MSDTRTWAERMPESLSAGYDVADPDVRRMLYKEAYSRIEYAWDDFCRELLIALESDVDIMTGYLFDELTGNEHFRLLLVSLALNGAAGSVDRGST